MTSELGHYIPRVVHADLCDAIRRGPRALSALCHTRVKYGAHSPCRSPRYAHGGLAQLLDAAVTDVFKLGGAFSLQAPVIQCHLRAFHAHGGLARLIHTACAFTDLYRTRGAFFLQAHVIQRGLRLPCPRGLARLLYAASIDLHRPRGRILLAGPRAVMPSSRLSALSRCPSCPRGG